MAITTSSSIKKKNLLNVRSSVGPVEKTIHNGKEVAISVDGKSYYDLGQKKWLPLKDDKNDDDNNNNNNNNNESDEDEVKDNDDVYGDEVVKAHYLLRRSQKKITKIILPEEGIVIHKHNQELINNQAENQERTKSTLLHATIMDRFRKATDHCVYYNATSKEDKEHPDIDFFDKVTAVFAKGASMLAVSGKMPLTQSVKYKYLGQEYTSSLNEMMKMVDPKTNEIFFQHLPREAQISFLDAWEQKRDKTLKGFKIFGTIKTVIFYAVPIVGSTFILIQALITNGTIATTSGLMSFTTTMPHVLLGFGIATITIGVVFIGFHVINNYTAHNANAKSVMKIHDISNAARIVHEKQTTLLENSNIAVNNLIKQAASGNGPVQISELPQPGERRPSTGIYKNNDDNRNDDTNSTHSRQNDDNDRKPLLNRTDSDSDEDLFSPERATLIRENYPSDEDDDDEKFFLPRRTIPKVKTHTAKNDDEKPLITSSKTKQELSDTELSDDSVNTRLWTKKISPKDIKLEFTQEDTHKDWRHKEHSSVIKKDYRSPEKKLEKK